MDASKSFAIDQSIKDHLRHYHSALSTGAIVKLSSLVDTYKAMSPSLHPYLASPVIDISALNYALTRLPLQVTETDNLTIDNDLEKVLAQTSAGQSWVRVSSVNRRRLSFYHSVSRTLTMVITSDSDIDDIVNALITIYIESQKIHQLLKRQKKSYDEAELAYLFGISSEQWHIFKNALGSNWQVGLSTLGTLADISITLNRSPHDYAQNFDLWVDQLANESLYLDFYNLPVYFVSSNTHSLTNLITGYVWSIEAKIFTFIEKEYPLLYEQWQKVKSSQDSSQVYDFVYYFSKIYQEHHPEEVRLRHLAEAQKGIRRIVSRGAFDSVTQIISIKSLPTFTYPDPQLSDLKDKNLEKSPAIIINVEYPLGQAAFYLLKSFLSRFTQIRGIYIIGKAAILNGNIGDIQIPKIVLDEKTGSSFTFDNCFNRINITAKNVAILESQKALSLHGTYLENRRQMESYLSSGFNVVEMESGSYLAAIYQQLHPETTVFNGNYEISTTPYELGIINYASDNPLVQTLGDQPLITRGIEPTYLATSAVIHRIIELEAKAVKPSV